ncbi:hypothetical protein CWC00_14750 [Pseudoalteromonas rubra]|nr:hypothetical protein CWC00_14750 [Pseudoalteromonas rubra]
MFLVCELYQFHLIPVQFEGANRTLTALKISHLEQLNSKIFALLSSIFSRLKIERLIKQIGINWILIVSNFFTLGWDTQGT